MSGRAARRGRARWTMASLAAVAAWGGALLVLGLRGDAWHLLFGGAMFALAAIAGLLQHLAERPGREGETPSLGERASWQQLGVAMAAILVLGGLGLGSMQGVLSAHLFFAAYATVIAAWPLMRRRFVDGALRHRDVAGDERDLALRAQGERLAKRLLELGLVAIAVAWVVVPELLRGPQDPVRVASLLLLPILLANAAGEARVAWLYWRDRR